MQLCWKLFAAIASFIALTAAAAPDRSMHPIPGDPVQTATGQVAGTLRPSGVRAYLGIPFAAPPLENLRWAAPQALRWSGVWNADRKGPQCMQVMRPHDINHYFGEEVSSEDCLYLNIWTPPGVNADAKLPVIVFIHGGGFTIGTSGMAIYEGEDVAAKGAVFVSMNYRVGALGFMAHPELTAAQGGHSGNYGLMDQIAALQWVRANISHFGGDPARVVIMGQSAGASSVVAHLFSPLSKGLFSGAIMSSGCNVRQDGQSLAEAEQAGLQLQQHFKAADIAALRNVAADRIIAAQSESQLGMNVSGVRFTGPIVDGYVIPERRAEALSAKRINAVPIIAGFTTNDLAFGYEPLLSARTVSAYEQGARALYGTDAAEFLKLFPAKSDAEVPLVARRAATAAGFEASARHCAQTMGMFGKPAFLYEFARTHPYAPGVRIADQNIATVGAYHTADIPYWFGTLDRFNWLRPTRIWSEGDRLLSRRMAAALIAFAGTGDPATADLAWPSWTRRGEAKIVFGTETRLEPLARKRHDWLAQHPVALAPAPVRKPGVPID